TATVSQVLPLYGSEKVSKSSSNSALALYGTPFFCRYPGRRCVVTTLRSPFIAALAPPRPRRPPAYSQLASESPCQVGSALGGALPKCSRRVCVPASVSIFSVLSSAHVM